MMMREERERGSHHIQIQSKMQLEARHGDDIMVEKERHPAQQKEETPSQRKNDMERNLNLS